MPRRAITALCLLAGAIAMVAGGVPADAVAKKRGAKKCVAAKKQRCKKGSSMRASGGAARTAWAPLRAWSRAPGSTQAPVAVAPGAGNPVAAGPSPALGSFASVRAREFSFVLSRPALAAGRLRLQLQNSGEDDHNLVLATAGGAQTLSQSGDVAPGAQAELTPTLGAGTYRLYCSLGDHASRGMSATLEVR